MRRLHYCQTNLIADVLGIVERLLRHRFAAHQILLLFRSERLLGVPPFIHKTEKIYQRRVSAVKAQKRPHVSVPNVCLPLFVVLGEHVWRYVEL